MGGASSYSWKKEKPSSNTLCQTRMIGCDSLPYVIMYFAVPRHVKFIYPQSTVDAILRPVHGIESLDPISLLERHYSAFGAVLV